MSDLTQPQPSPLPAVPLPSGTADRLACIVDSLSEGVLCLNRSWHITYANPEAIRISRLEPALFPSKTYWEIFPDLAGSNLEARCRAAMDTRQADRCDLSYPPFELSLDIHILPTDEGIALHFRDCNAQRRAETRELAGERDRQQILEAIPDAIVMVNREWKFTFANQRALQLVNEPNVVGHNLFELFPGNLEEPFHSCYRKTMAERVPTEFEAFYDGSLKTWFTIHARPHDDGIIIFFSDITERRLSELREKQTAQRLAQVMDVTSDSILTLDRDWNITYLNPRAAELLDPDKRLLGRNMWKEFPHAVDSPVWEMYHRSMHLGLPGHAVVFYPEPLNGWFEVQSEPTPDGIVAFFRDITERKLHDDRMREQHNLLSSVQDAVMLATWELDLRSGALRYGIGSYPVYGHPLDALPTHEALLSIVHPEDVSVITAAFTRTAETGQRSVFDFRVLTANGNTLPLEARAQVVLDDAGAAIGLRGLTLNNADCKRSEAALRASEERYRVLADLNPLAIWMGDASGQITYANQGFLAYIGLVPEDLAGQGWLQAFAPEARERVVATWTRSVQTGVDYDIEARLRNGSTGELRWWHLKAAPVRDSSGAILHWLGVASDIHDAKTHAEALRDQQAQAERRRAELETVYRTSPVGLALLDPVHFTFLNLNDHEADMLGLPKDQILGRRLSEIAPPDKLPGLLERMREVAAGKHVRDHLLEGELAVRPGDRRAWNVNYSPVYNEDGSIRAISSASIEITNQKKAEAALIQSEKLAAVGRLASSISHEINNPLEAITNLLYLIALDEKLPETLKLYVHMAQSELSRVSQIATQTLRFHRQAVAPTLVTAQDLVGAVVKLYAGRLANSGIKVVEQYGSNTRILCFENDIRQVFNNLIANAIDAMRTGGRLLIRAHASTDYAVPDGRSGVRITVADNGHGMSPATLARAFEPFFTTKDLQGTGLGLWISKGIVERHQGRLSVRSAQAEGRHGTLFTLFLPCHETPPPADATPVLSSPNAL